MNNILITGGAGFIGSNFIHYLLAEEPSAKIVNLDSLTYAGTLENIREILDVSRHTFVRGDITDTVLIKNLLNRHSIDTIVHFAAETHVDRSILYPRDFVQTNILGTLNLLESAKEFWISESQMDIKKVRFHHVSTDEVFGSLVPGDPAWVEESPYLPNSPYAASKASSDHFVRAYGHTYCIPYTITNCSNNYGPRQFPEKLIPLMILNALKGMPLPIYGDGMQIRDWLHVLDHCKAIHLILKKAIPGSSYNIGGKNQFSNLSVVIKICHILDELLPESKNIPHEKLIQFVMDRPGHDRRYDMDIQKIKAELEWTPRLTLDQGLRDTVKWYLSHPEWVAAVCQQQGYKSWIDINYKSR
jgi:dTDP-glucose 4,6-dehydratase